MSEMLLGQNIALIYKFVEQAIKLNSQYQYWEGLKMLGFAEALVYKDGANHGALDAFDVKIKAIQDEAKTAASQLLSPESQKMRFEDTLNAGAAKVFNESLREFRDYMQKVGYYSMMNKGWKSIDETEKMPIQNLPPKKKNYHEKLSSELL